MSKRLVTVVLVQISNTPPRVFKVSLGNRQKSADTSGRDGKQRVRVVQRA